MGAGNSKPEASGGSNHVFSSASPIQFSSNLVDTLQTSAETDSSRAKTLELQIQARVAQELDRIRSREQQTIQDIEKRLAESKQDSSSTTTPSTATVAMPAAAPLSPSTSPTVPGSLNLDAPRIPFAGREYSSAVAVPVSGTGEQGQQQQKQVPLSHDSVAGGIQQLRSKLEGRRKLMELDEGVERARGDVVGCLRLNDRRPLDCWKEVEGFKREVARLEEAFVDRVVG